MEKIMFYVHSLNKGGAERVMLTVGEELTKNHEVVILTDCVDEREYALPKSIRRINIEDVLKEQKKTVNSRNRLLTIRKVCKEEKPKCVVAFMMTSSTRCLLANAFSGVKVISTIRSDPFEFYGSFKKRFFVNMVFAMSKAIVCQTTYQQTYFYKPIRKKSVVILNPIFKEFRVQPFKGKRTDRIVATGRLVDFKNYELMIEGFSKVANDYPNINLEIFGEGPMRPILEKIISDLGMEERVLLKGDSTDVAHDIVDGLFYIMTTNSEGMPNSLMEAMALGMPVLSTDCLGDGARILIQDGYNGLLIPTKDIVALEVAIRRMLDNEDMRNELAEHAIEIQERCNIVNIAKEWQDLWSDVK